MGRKKITLTVYSDPSHAWCKVSQKLVDELNIQNQISRYSYKRKDSVYLEEDCDLTYLIDALKAQNPEIIIKYNEHHSNKQSKIRSYVPYNQLTLTGFLKDHLQVIVVGDR